MPGNPISADDLLEWGIVNRFFLSDSLNERKAGNKNMKHPTPSPETIILSFVLSNGSKTLAKTMITFTIINNTLATFFLPRNRRSIGLNKNKTVKTFSFKERVIKQKM